MGYTVTANSLFCMRCGEHIQDIQEKKTARLCHSCRLYGHKHGAQTANKVKDEKRTAQLRFLLKVRLK